MPTGRSSLRRAGGVALLELLVFIVVVGIGVAGILLVMNVTTSRSADPMLVAQARFIAESYLDEVLLKAFVDPVSSTVCPAPPASRAAYDNVCDYHGLANAGAVDRLGTSVAGLEAYQVSVQVSGAPGESLGSVNNSGAVRVLRVTVSVTHPQGAAFTLTGYRTNYNCYNATDPGCAPL